MEQVVLQLATTGEPIPATLLMPDFAAPVPAALLLHGWSSYKEQMLESAGCALLRCGIASLAIDLPLHGEREGSVEELTLRNPIEILSNWRRAIKDAEEALRRLAEHPLVDRRRLAIVGYSLGAFVGLMVAAEHREARALVIAAGGDLPEDTPFAALIRTVADPLRAVRALAGRPLLMVNGHDDTVVRTEQVMRLFNAAGEPKEIQWYADGHWPPQSAIESAADWLAARFDDRAHSRLA